MVTASPPGRSEASSTITVNPPYSPLASAALTAPAPQEHATGTETAIISVPSPSPAAIETAARPNSSGVKTAKSTAHAAHTGIQNSRANR